LKIRELLLQISPARTFNRSIGRDFERVLSKCLRKHPQERYGSVESLRDDIKKIRLEEQYEHHSSLPGLWTGFYVMVAFLIQFVTPQLLGDSELPLWDSAAPGISCHPCRDTRPEQGGSHQLPCRPIRSDKNISLMAQEIKSALLAEADLQRRMK